MKQITLYMMILVILLIAAYYMAQLGKVISYEWWYKDMVKETVNEMVKKEALK